MTGIVIVGFGGHAAVITDAIRSVGKDAIAGYTDLRPHAQAPASIPFLGTDDAFLDAFDPASPLRFVLGLAGTKYSPARAALAECYRVRGASFTTVVHARAWVAPDATLADGAVVFANAVVNPGARVGLHGIVNTGAVVEHDVTVGDFTSVAPGAVIGGGARIGARSYVGLGARVRDHVTIGEGVTVAMGAVVVADVPDGALVMGVPARVQKGERTA